MVVASAGTPELLWYDLGTMPRAPTCTLRRAAAPLGVAARGVGADGNTAIAFLHSACSSGGGGGGVSSTGGVAGSGGGWAAGGRRTVSQRCADVTPLGSGASSGAAAGGQLVVAGDAHGFVRLWDVRAGGAPVWCVDSMEPVRRLPSRGGGGGTGAGASSVAVAAAALRESAALAGLKRTRLGTPAAALGVTPTAAAAVVVAEHAAAAAHRPLRREDLAVVSLFHTGATSVLHCATATGAIVVRGGSCFSML